MDSSLPDVSANIIDETPKVICYVIVTPSGRVDADRSSNYNLDGFLIALWSCPGVVL